MFPTFSRHPHIARKWQYHGLEIAFNSQSKANERSPYRIENNNKKKNKIERHQQNRNDMEILKVIICLEEKPFGVFI